MADRSENDASRPDTRQAPPTVDWLTGLASRATFSRLVTQTDRDRDRATIALIAIRDFGGVNRQFGHDAGDDLLRTMAGRIGGESSAEVTAARLDGAEFGLLNTRGVNAPVKDWLRPVVSGLRSDVGHWVRDQVDQLADFADEPQVVVGYATGTGAGLWADAATALELAKENRGRGREGIENIVGFDPGDRRIIELEARRTADRRIIDAAAAGDLSVTARRIDMVGREDDSWCWLRLGAAHPDQVNGLNPIDSSELQVATGQRVEHWLIRQAGDLIGETSAQLRVTVPIPTEARLGKPFGRRLFPILERRLVPPSRIGFEIDHTTLTASLDRGERLVRQLNEIGSTVTVSNCCGGWDCWETIKLLPVRYLKPSQRLIDAAAANTTAARILGAMAAEADEGEHELVAPFSAHADDRLRELGFTYVERSRASANSTLNGMGRLHTAVVGG